MAADYPICPLCLELPWHVVVTPCGHQFCHACFDRVLESNLASATVPCPVCRKPVPAGGAAQWRDAGVDAALRAEYPDTWQRREQQYRLEQMLQQRGRQQQQLSTPQELSESEEDQDGGLGSPTRRRGVRMSDALLERAAREQGQYRAAIHLNSKLALPMSRLLR